VQVGNLHKHPAVARGSPRSTGFQPVSVHRGGLGAAHTPSPDVHSGHPALRSLDAALASPSWLRSTSNAGSRGTGSPSLSAYL